MGSRSLTCLLTLIAGLSMATPVLAATPQEIVAAADKVRNPDQAFRSTVTVVAYKGGKPIDSNAFDVYAKIDAATDSYRDILVYRSPPRDARKVMLFNSQYLWFFDPASKDSVQISLRQQLIGQANAGDILMVNFASEYKPTLVGQDTITDANSKPRTCWRLDLKPATPDAIYNRIEYWVEQTSNQPIKAKMYADSGRLLKILYYRKVKTQTGSGQSPQAVILDAVDPTLVTTIDIGNSRAMDIPDLWFQREYLPNIKTE